MSKLSMSIDSIVSRNRMFDVNEKFFRDHNHSGHETCDFFWQKLQELVDQFSKIIKWKTILADRL